MTGFFPAHPQFGQMSDCFVCDLCVCVCVGCGVTTDGTKARTVL